MAGVFGVRGNAAGFFQASLLVNVLDGRESSCSDVTGGFHHHLQGPVFSSSEDSIPDYNTANKSVLTVEVSEELL